MTQLPPHYHVGIIVTDIMRARTRLHDLLGVTWGPVTHLDEVHYRDGTGNDLTLPTTICYSTGTPALELIEEVPGTVWVRNQHSNLHHIGFWTDDFDTDTAVLGAGGCPLQLCGRDGATAPVSFAYHHDDDIGVRFEIVDTTMRDAMSFLFEPDPDTGSS